MINGAWCAEAGLSAIGILGGVKFADSDRRQSMTVGFGKRTVTGGLNRIFFRKIKFYKDH